MAADARVAASPRPCQFDDRTPTASHVLVGERVPAVLVLLVMNRVKELI